MDASNRVITTLAVTLVLATVAVKLQSEPVRPIADTALVASAPEVAPSKGSSIPPVLRGLEGSNLIGAPNPASQYGVAQNGYEEDRPQAYADNSVNDEVYDDTYDPDSAAYQPPSLPDIPLDVNGDYPPPEPGVVSDQEILNQILSTLDADQRAAFTLQWSAMTPDDRADFLANMRGE